MSLIKTDSVERLPIRLYTEQAYLDYSMYVILDRALPHISDGLKPVQRRIIYAMSELGLSAQSKHKKSARTVGDVLGKFHPHGDSACYEAMVLMAQTFSSRYPLIDGQGNWGSADDPKSFAAMRYTEAKLTPFAELFLSELGDKTIDWMANFDGTLFEPKLLPARVPAVLLNGISGIAVGMATDIPPHNLKEVLDASVLILDNPDVKIEEVCALLPAPDFPTGAEIVSSKTDLQNLYATGSGSVRMRAVYHSTENKIIITALPYQASPARIIEQVASQMNAKKLPMLVDLRDESDHKQPIRLVLIARSTKINVEELMQHLFATTDLEKSIRVNMNVVGVDGRPKVKPLIKLLKEWLDWRRQTVTKRTENRLAVVRNRLHLIEGFVKAYDKLDQIIMFIRTEDDPLNSLIKKLGFTSEQADAIMNLRLKSLASLEEKKLVDEKNLLSSEQIQLLNVLNSSTLMTDLIRNELNGDSVKFSDQRRSLIVRRLEAKVMSHEKRISPEPVTIVLSEQGWIRVAKGFDVDPESMSFKVGDSFLTSAQGKLSDNLIVFDESGRCYTLATHELPTARGQGEPLSGRIDLTANQKLVALAIGELNCFWLLASNGGYGFICKHADLVGRNRKGKKIIQIGSSRLLQPLKLSSNYLEMRIACVSSAGYLLLLDLVDIPRLLKGKGSRLMSLSSKQMESGHCLVSAVPLKRSSSLKVYAGKRFLTIGKKDLVSFFGKRGGRGYLLPRGLRRVDKLEEIS